MEESTNAAGDQDRYLIVSTDSHVGPLMKEQLRDYCPPKYLEEFDDYVASWEPTRAGTWDPKSKPGVAPFTEKIISRTTTNVETAGVFDAAQRLKDMDAEGIAAEVIYHGAMTPDVIPFSPLRDREAPSLELQAVGYQMYNRWLADFVKQAPDRFIGALQVPLWDIDLSVKEVEWAAEAGLKCVNFPAPNRRLPGYNEPIYEPFWDVCNDTNLPLTTHGGGGDMPPYTGPETYALFMSDLFFYSRRGLWYLIWSGAFERHPNLKMIFTEQRSEWVPSTLAHLDSIYESEFHDWSAMIPRRPSEYFQDHCYVASSFMARFEVELRHEIGLEKLMWGSDYPHYEGSFHNTDLCLRATFAGIPTDEVRMILGTNALECFHLDGAALQPIADRIGPLVSDVDVPLSPDDYPEVRGCAFRTIGAWG